MSDDYQPPRFPRPSIPAIWTFIATAGLLLAINIIKGLQLGSYL